jgi:glyoxylase-like metal-dependent hydrolase (beta-lactamase superfamily II)
MQQISQSIFYEDSYLGVTVGVLIYSFGTIAIDAPLRAEDARSWRAAINNYRSGSNRLLVSLDAHPDRTLGTRALECTIVAHQKSAQVFRNRPTIFKGLSIETGSVWETYNESIGLRWASPDITFTDLVYLHWGGPEVILENQPGPTPGSIWVVIPESNTVFVGDTITIRQPPFLAQADLQVWIESLNVLQKGYNGYTIVSGRGGIAKTEDIKALIKLLKSISNSIEKLGAKNAPPEATLDLAAKVASKFTASGRQRELYLSRLQYGLHQYYSRRFRPANVIGQPEIEEDEQ